MSSSSSSSFANRYKRNQSPRDPAIRHAGRVHIRGKIRRIWRPRYLELCDTGLVRYYELPPTADVTMPEEADWQHVNMVIKDTLIIYNARIIDVTTLRDLHVGLPRGSYGFLFRGQRLYTAKYVNDLLSNQEPNPPREYFCAVSTLEEAQTWVIALQWAATMCQNHLQETNFQDEADLPSPSGGSQLIKCRLSSSSANPHYSADSSNAVLDGVLPNPNVSDASTTKTAKVGRILVTKVHGYRIIKMNSMSTPSTGVKNSKQFYGFFTERQWDVAYEVSLLLVHHRKVEERQILITADELSRLLDDISKAVKTSLLQPFLADLKTKCRDLPRFRSDDGDDGISNACTPESVRHSLSKVDGILRALAMEAAAVNSQAMKQALGLDVERPTIQDASWWKSCTRKKENAAIVVFRQVRQVPGHVTMDSYVRDWLGQTPAKPSTSQLWQMMEKVKVQTQFWVLRRTWFLVGGVGVTMALLYPASQIYQRNMLSMTIRVDFLAAGWFVAYWLGQKKGQSVGMKARKSFNAPSSPRVALRNAVHRTNMDLTGSYDDSDYGGSNQPVGPSSTNAGGSVIAEISIPPISVEREVMPEPESDDSAMDGEDLDYLEDEADVAVNSNIGKLSSPLPKYPENDASSCWSEPIDPTIFRVRGLSYLEDRVKVPSGPPPFKCRGVDVWMTDNPERHIARHPRVLGGKIYEQDTFLVNFLLPFGNFVAYFSVPPLKDFPNKQVANVWSNFVSGDQQYRDARLKLLPIVIDGPWIVKAAVGNGTAPALMGKVIPLQYFFQQPDSANGRMGVYEVDVIITASSIAKGILSVVKGHTKSLTIAFALIIEASTKEDLPETVLCSFQVHYLNLDDCPHLPSCNLDDITHE